MRIRKANLNGATVLRMGSVNNDVTFSLTEDIQTTPSTLVATLASVLDALKSAQGEHPVAKHLKSASKSIILLGAEAQSHPQATTIRALCSAIAALTNSSVATMTLGSNSAGAWIAGAVPHRKAAGESIDVAGLNTEAMFSEQRAAYILMNVEPEHDLIDSAKAIFWL